MKLNVVYASDENYAMFTGVSICSLFYNNKNIDDITVYILENQINSDSKEKLQNLGKKFNREIVFVDISEKFAELSKKITMKSTQTITAYASCFMAELLDDTVETVLYMDGDSLICGDLSELLNVDISDAYTYGALDIAAPIVRKMIGFDIEEPYINSGLLYMNLKKIREANLRNNLVKFIEEVIPTSMHNDQDVVNGVFKEKNKVLPLKFNVLTPLYEKSYKDIMWFYKMECYYSEEEVEEAIKNPLFVHFTASFTKRPWIKGCKHPLKPMWDFYKEMTPWSEVLDRKDNRKLKKKVLDFIYNYFGVYNYVKIVNLKRNIKKD